MKRLLMVTLAGMAILWSVISFAATSANTIGVVDMAVIMQTSPQAKKIQAELKKQFAGRNDDLMKLGKTLQANIKKMQRNESVMDKKGLAKLRKEIVEQQNQFRSDQMKFRQDIYAARNKAMESFYSVLQKVVAKVAEKNHLALVLPKEQLLYSDSSLDITKKVLKAL